MLDDAGALDGAEPAELAIPTSLQAMIGSRLDSLPAQDKSVAHHASVVGLVFWSGAVAELHRSGPEVDPSLEALEQRDLVRGNEEIDRRRASASGAFKHALIRDVAYARVPKGRRAHLHVRFADWMQRIPGAADELVEIVAYHLEQACRLAGVGRSEAPPPIERAVDALMHAAEKAERREGIREADRYYARALELVGDDASEQALELRLGRAGTLNTLGELQAGGGAARRGGRGGRRPARATSRARADRPRQHRERSRGAAAEARSHVSRGRVDRGGSSATGHSSVRVALSSRRTSSSWFDGELETAIEELRRGLDARRGARRQGARGSRGTCGWQALLYNLGDLRGAEEQLVRCAALLGEFGSLRDEARVTYQLGLVKYHRGELDEAERLGLAGARLARADRETATSSSRTCARSRSARSRGATSSSPRRGSATRCRSRARPAAGSWSRSTAASSTCSSARAASATRASSARPHASSGPKEDAYARAACLLIEANLTTAEGRRDEACECFGEALQAARGAAAAARPRRGAARVRPGASPARRRCRRGGRARAGPHDSDGMGALGLVGEIDRELAELGEGAAAGPLERS